MNIYFQGLNACIGRRPDVERYALFIKSCGHTLVPNPQDADLLLIWACGFRRDFADNSFKLIQQYAETYGTENVVVCGCLPAIDEQHLKKVFHGKYFNWATDTEAMDELFKPGTGSFSDSRRVLSESQYTKEFRKFWEEDSELDASYYDQFTKVFISEGCRYRCAYCAERLAFPEYNSFPVEDILTACRKELSVGGSKNIMLIGDSLGDFGRDADSSLPELIDAIFTLDPEVKVGLLNLNPADFYVFKDYLLRFSKTALFLTVCFRYNASDRLLEKMQRTYTKHQVEEIAQTLNDMKFREWTSHFIVGFPSETEEDHEQSLEFLRKYKPKYVMASSYMESPNMPSASIGDKVPAEVAHERLMRMANLCKELGIICNHDGSEYAEHRNARRNKKQAS